MLLLFLMTCEIYGQVPAGITVVVKNPSWQAEDAAKESLEKADRIRQITTLTEQVNTQKRKLTSYKRCNGKA